MPEKYKLPDIPMQPFIDEEEIIHLLRNTKPDKQQVVDVVAKSLDRQRLSLQELAVLLNVRDNESIEYIKQAAHELKEKIYGRRVVLFAPLYVGNHCVNNCTYCGFRTANKDAVRMTLTRTQLVCNVRALESEGHKRLIVVFGEHRDYTPEFIADTIRTIYGVKHGSGEIRRLNVNAAPLDIEGFRTVKKSGIGTCQIFQETYHPETYLRYHLSGPKRDYNYRLTALDRAQEAGIDDVGIGALFGLYHWRFEAMALLRHANHLEACYRTGPHTVSFPRLQMASNAVFNPDFGVNDTDFIHLVAALRLAVPYTGLICTAREPLHVRNEALRYGVTQIDGGTRLELDSYSEQSVIRQDLRREQFHLSDSRSLQLVIGDLLRNGYLPSFCTACYRKGRTGEHFMELSVPGFIKRFCTPNAIYTLTEYLEDYAPEPQKIEGYSIIEQQLTNMEEQTANQIRETIIKIRSGMRDLYL